MANFSFRHQLTHSSHNIFDRYRNVTPVQIEKIDHVYGQTTKALINCLTNVWRIVDDANGFPVGRARDPHFGCNGHLASSMLCHLTDSEFIPSVTIDVCRVDEGDTDIECMIECCNVIFMSTVAIHASQCHSTEPHSAGD